MMLANLAVEAFNSVPVDACDPITRPIVWAAFHCDTNSTELCEDEGSSRGTFSFALQTQICVA